jgi:hypothetical protein
LPFIKAALLGVLVLPLRASAQEANATPENPLHASAALKNCSDDGSIVEQTADVAQQEAPFGRVYFIISKDLAVRSPKEPERQAVSLIAGEN